VLWIIVSLAFSVYTANFGKYNQTYGSLGAVIVSMLWLFLTALSVLIGAEVNAELERQTARDTTEGRPMPLGARNAHSADTLGKTADEISRKRGSPSAGEAAAVNGAPAAPVGPTAQIEVPLPLDGFVGLAARAFGVRADRAWALIADGTLTVRYGPWVMRAELANIRSIEVTGPYRPWRVAGPAHVSLTDLGLTFATNAAAGVCVQFDEPVPGLLPTRMIVHPGLTFTVAEPERFAATLRACMHHRDAEAART
jgi:hypothetical protein